MTLPKNYTAFLETLDNSKPSLDWPETLRALWWDAKGNWNASHHIAQDIPNEIGNWIHAYLHRKEGDEFNARYWYRRANRTFPKKSLEEEHRELVEYVLGGDFF